MAGLGVVDAPCCSMWRRHARPSLGCHALHAVSFAIGVRAPFSAATVSGGPLGGKQLIVFSLCRFRQAAIYRALVRWRGASESELGHQRVLRRLFMTAQNRGREALASITKMPRKIANRALA